MENEEEKEIGYGGWITLHRKITSWEWYTDGNVFRVFIHLLLLANHEDKKWKGRVIQRGQRLTSIRHLAAELDMSEMTVQRALKVLISNGSITKNSTPQGTIITIVNYTDYQHGVLTSVTQPSTLPSTLPSTPPSTKQQYNNDNNIQTYTQRASEFFLPVDQLDRLIQEDDVRYLIHARSQLTDEQISLYLEELKTQLRTVNFLGWNNKADFLNHICRWYSIKAHYLKQNDNGNNNKQTQPTADELRAYADEQRRSAILSAMRRQQ